MVAKMYGQDQLVRFLVGIVGSVVTGFLFLSPGPTIWKIFKNNSTEEFSPYPYVAMVINCCLGIIHGLVMEDSGSTVIISSVGLFLGLCYVTTFVCFTTQKYRVIIGLSLLGEVVVCAVIAAVTFRCLHTDSTRYMFVGIACVISGTILHGSHLFNLRDVIKTRHAELLPFWPSLAGFTNGVVSVIYACFKPFDPYIAAVNGIEGLLGLIQLIVYAYYKKRGSDVEARAVQL